jgi:hypothetical protein
MLLVILGAGASHDSINPNTVDLAPYTRPRSVYDYKPPLANGLFDNRPNFGEVLDEFHEAVGLVAHLRRRVQAGSSVEQELEQVQSEKTDARGRQELVAVKFYLQWTLWKCSDEWWKVGHGVTNYGELLRRLRIWAAKNSDEPICLVTFNYDTILERSLDAVVGLRIESFDSYTQGAFKLFKLHGSVNWGHNLGFKGSFPNWPMAAHHLISEAADAPEDNYVLLGSTSDVNMQGHVTLPAIAIPVQQKAVFECPEPQLAQLRTLLPNTTQILALGWRATEQHFIALLRETLQRERVQRALIVAGEARDANSPKPGHEVISNLSGTIACKMDDANSTFSDFVGSERLEAFLS